MKKIVKGWECTWFSREVFAHEDKKKLANEMGMFFIKKIADIRLDLDNHDNNKLPQTAFLMTSKLILYSSSLFLCLKKKCTTWFEHPVRSLVA